MLELLCMACLVRDRRRVALDVAGPERDCCPSCGRERWRRSGRVTRRPRRTVRRPSPYRTIESLLTEERRYAPPAEFAAAGERERSRRLSARGRRPRGLLGRGGRRARLVQALDRVLEWDAALGEVVRRRRAQRLRTTASTATSRPGARNKAAIIWEGEPGDERVADLPRALPRGEPAANALKRARRQEGRPRRHLHAA